MEKEAKLTIHHIFWYFVIFSIVGIVLETVYCYITTGVLESRKGLIWGPFCPVYGVSASVLIIMLNKYQHKSAIRLFAYGFVIGSIAEYILSFCLEAIYGIRFWDYVYAKGDINGRICLLFSFYWGVLSAIIMKLIKPILDKLINKIPTSGRNIAEIILFIFFIINCIFTVWGIQTYQNRVVYGKENNTQSKNILIQIQEKIENEYFTNERMSKTFPNLRIKDSEGNEIWIRTLIDDK